MCSSHPPFFAGKAANVVFVPGFASDNAKSGLMRLRSGPRMVARSIALMNSALFASVSFFTQKTRLVSDDLSLSNWYGCSSLNGDIVTSLESLRYKSGISVCRSPAFTRFGSGPRAARLAMSGLVGPMNVASRSRNEYQPPNADAFSCGARSAFKLKEKVT